MPRLQRPIEERHDAPMSPLIDQYLNELQALEQSPRTIRLRRWQLKTWSNHIGNIQAPVSRSQLVDFLNNYSDSATRTSILAGIRGFYRWAMETGQLDANPSESIRRPRTKKCLPRPIPDREYQLAEAAAGARIRDMLVLARFAGMRGHEIGPAHSTHMTRGGLWILGKGNKERIVPVHPKVAQVFAAADGYLFPTTRKLQPLPHLSDGVVTRYANKHLAVYAPGWTLHTLRHAFITEFYSVSEHDLLLTADVAGHSNVNTTRGYTALSNDRAQAVVLKLNADSRGIEHEAA